MYVAPPPDPGDQRGTVRPRSMLQGHTSYARPYHKSQTVVSQESLVSSVYRSRSHSAPKPGRPRAKTVEYNQSSLNLK